jgi:DNA-directed RNA polymerase subunit RPC12/RpoP
MFATPYRCVACNRAATEVPGTCPYCGEAIFESPRRRVVRHLALLALVLGTPLFAHACGWRNDWLRPTPHPIANGIFLALGLGMLLMPGRPDRGPTPMTRADDILRTARDLAGTLLTALAAFVTVLTVRNGNPTTLFCVVTALPPLLGLAVAPGSGIASWRGTAAGMLMAIGWTTRF